MDRNIDLALIRAKFVPLLTTISGVLAAFVSKEQATGESTILVAIDWTNFTYPSAAVVAMFSICFEDAKSQPKLQLKPVRLDDFKRILCLDDSWQALMPGKEGGHG